MKKDYRRYRILFVFLRIVLFPFYRLKFIGRENIPEGAAMICANHTSFLDPIFLAFALGIRHHPRFMGKASLFRVPLLGKIYKAVGSFAVERGKTDIAAVKAAIGFLKSGEKVVIFPEGTRVRGDVAVAAKQGAVRIADQVNVPVVPVYIPGGKRLFGRYTVVIGRPYYVNPEKVKLTGEDYLKRAEELMDKIRTLGNDVMR